MKMLPEEIIRSYEESPSRSTLIDLAGKNDCDMTDIMILLEDNGVEIEKYSDEELEEPVKEEVHKPTATIKQRVKPGRKPGRKPGSQKSDKFKNQLQAIVDEVKNENEPEKKPRRKPGRKPGNKSDHIIEHHLVVPEEKTPTQILKDTDIAIENAIKALDAKIAVLEKKRQLLKEALEIDEI